MQKIPLSRDFLLGEKMAIQTEEIIKLMSDNIPRTQKEIANHFGVRSCDISRKLHTAINKGVISKDQNGLCFYIDHQLEYEQPNKLKVQRYEPQFYELNGYSRSLLRQKILSEVSRNPETGMS